MTLTAWVLHETLDREAPMLVGKRMTKDPVTANPEDLLIQARLKMEKGGFSAASGRE